MICLLRVGFEEDQDSQIAADGPGSDRFGIYRIERREDGTLWELGRGAMGVTYRAIDTSLERAVALKLIAPEWLERGEEARERFMREARVAAALRHPNVATVYHFGIREETGHCFCAMELVEGETLETRVRRTGPLDARTTIEIALQIASALAAAEKQGLVHRDLKPGNLMIAAAESERTDGEPLVKVIDFGVAKALAEKPDAMGLTHGGFVGTPAFASPEQFANAPVDVRSDIYSLGATLWYLLTGQLPFPGAGAQEIRAAQQSLPLEQLKGAGVPRCLVALIASMLNTQPAARPGTRELASRLQACRAQLLDRWRTARRLALAAAIIGIAIGAALPFLRRPNNQPAAIPEKSIAVLPFENLSGDQSNSYFADGIQDQILTKLASVADLKVISRSSTAKYKTRAEDLKVVSQQLGVATVVQGTVQKAGDRIRVNVQLIDARADTHLWAKSYDREVADVFGLQSEISQQIADALHAKLSPSETLVLAAAPTRDSEAYDLFLRGEYEQRRGETILAAEPLDRAAGFYREALARDANFTLAAARLARSQLWRHWFVTALTPDELEGVKRRVDEVLIAAPDLADAHMALGMYHYHGHRDYEPALAAFRRALELQPNHALARLYSGYVYRRQAEWARSLEEMRKAESLDPRDPAVPGNIAATYVNLRQWADAKRAASRSIALDPQNVIGQLALFQSHLNGDGSTDGARRALAALPRVALTTNAIRGSVSNVIEDFTYLHVMERDFAGALQQSAKEAGEPNERVGRLVARVAIRVLAGDRSGDASESEEARVLLEGRLAVRPNDAFTMAQLSWVYLALGRDADALHRAKAAAESLPLEKDAFGAPALAIGLAQVQAHAGQPGDAIKTLRHMLSIPAGIAISVNRLKRDPVWDPIRSDPAFAELIAGPEFVGALPNYGQ